MVEQSKKLQLVNETTAKEAVEKLGNDEEEAVEELKVLKRRTEEQERKIIELEEENGQTTKRSRLIPAYLHI